MVGNTRPEIQRDKYKCADDERDSRHPFIHRLTNPRTVRRAGRPMIVELEMLEAKSDNPINPHVSERPPRKRSSPVFVLEATQRPITKTTRSRYNNPQVDIANRGFHKAAWLIAEIPAVAAHQRGDHSSRAN